MPRSLRPVGASRWTIYAIQVGLVILIVSAWWYLPKQDWLREIASVFNEFFLSSPEDVVSALRRMLTDGELQFWGHIWFTLQGMWIGYLSGTILAVFMALLLNNSRTMDEALTPLIDFANAVPTIVTIPIVVLMFGPTLTTSAVVATQTTFFFTFFNAYVGGGSTPSDLIHGAQLLGASKGEVARKIRARFAIAWTVAIAPGAVGRALTAAFVAELLSGSDGLGRLVLRGLLTLNASLTFAVVLVLSLLGLTLSVLVPKVSESYIRWWAASR